MLIIRLMKKCNNDCVMCMVRDEMESSDDPTLEEIKTMISEHKKGSEIDFFGGEPTLYPHFIEAVDYATRNGYIVQIASNGRVFSDNEYLQKILALGVAHIRTSLYGAVPATHDRHTRIDGSFDETVAGIKNMVQCNMDMLVNIVITAINYCSLLKIVELLISLGVKHIKFSTLIKAMNCLEYVPNNAEVRPYLTEAIEKCVRNKVTVEIEKSAYCLAPEFQAFYLDEEKCDALYTTNTNCNWCAVKHACPGIPVEQVYKYGEQHPLTIPILK